MLLLRTCSCTSFDSVKNTAEVGKIRRWSVLACQLCLRKRNALPTGALFYLGHHQRSFLLNRIVRKFPVETGAVRK